MQTNTHTHGTEIRISDSATDALAARRASQQAEKPVDARLTRREQEVLLLVAEGDSTKQVAEALFVSKRTVDFHLANVFDKLAVHNRVQAVNKARRLRLLHIPNL